MQTKGDAMYRGNSHKDGGIDVVVDGEKPIEVEGYEYKICKGAYNSPDRISRTGTNKQILDFIHGEFSCNFEQPKADSGDFILCKLVVLDTATKKREGTVREILDEMQAEKNCRISNQNQPTMQTLERGGQAQAIKSVAEVVNTTEDFSPDKIKQAIEKVASTREWFNHLLTKFIPSVKRLAPANSTVYARTKTTQSILNKLVDKRMIDSECPKKGLTDLIGFTIAVNSYDELKKVRNEVEGGALGEVVETEDMYETPKGGYRAIHFILWLKTDKGKVPVELQLKTRRMKSLNELSHEPYKRKALNAERMDELAALALKADAGNFAAQTKWKEVISDEAAVEKSLYKKEYAAGGMLVDAYTNYELSDVEIHSAGLPPIFTDNAAPQTIKTQISIIQWLNKLGAINMRTFKELPMVIVEYKGREFYIEFTQHKVLVKGSAHGKPLFIIPTSSQSGIVVSGKKMKLVSGDYADSTQILAEAIVHAFDRAIKEKSEKDLSEEIIAADLPIPATYEMDFRQPQILENALVDALRNNGASHIIPSGELNGLYFTYLGKRFFVFDNEFEFKLDCLNPSVYIDQVDKGNSIKDTATDIIITASNFYNNPQSFTAEIEPREEGAASDSNFSASAITEGSITNGLRSRIWEAIHHIKTADEKFELGGGVGKEMSQEDFEEWLDAPQRKKIRVHGSPLSGLGSGLVYGVLAQNDETAWFVPVFPNGDLNFLETALPQYKSDLLVAVNNFLSGKSNGIELLPLNEVKQEDESDKYYTKAVYVPIEAADKFKLQLTKAGLAWDSFDETERFSNMRFGFTKSQMERIKDFVNEYAIEVTEYAEGGLIPNRGAETKFGKVISAFRQPLAVRSVTIKGMNDAALDKFIDNCMADYVDTIQVGNNHAFIVGDSIEEIARKTDRHIPAGQQVTDYKVAYAITDKDVVISDDDVIGEYETGGKVEEGDRVIITTSSLGKQYEGMSGTITPRKLLNDKYSIKLENGMEMAFSKDEFRHNSVNPKYRSGGALEKSPEIMEDDCVITSNGYKYSVACGGKFIKECQEMDDALQAVIDWQDENKWYPSIWFISDHGNPSLIDAEGNIVRYANGGIVRDENGGEFDIYNLSERQINKRLADLGWTRSELNNHAPETKRQFLEEAYELAGYANGGIVSFVKPEASHKKTWYSRGVRDGRECIGSFDIKTPRSWTEFYLYNISEFDEDYYKHIILKPAEKLYRYETDTTKISGLFPIIKINRENGLVYFLADLYAEDDKNLVFQSRGLKPRWLSLSESEKFSFGGLLPITEYAKGGEIKKWVGRDFQSSSGKTPEFMEFAKDFKKAIVKNMDGYELIKFNKGHFYLSGFFKNKTNGNLVYFSTSDVREGGRSSWNDRLLIRTAKSEKDYTGGSNNYTTFDGIKAKADQLTTKSKEVTAQSNTPATQSKSRDLNEMEHEALSVGFSGGKPSLSASSYKNAYELNKAIESLIDQKNSDKPEDYTSDEKQFISLYSGMGGLEKYGAKGVGLFYEYFTPDTIAQKMWGLAYKNGFKGGNVLEPSVGVGAFLKYAGENCNVEGFEINKYSYTICRILFPSVKLYHQAFEQRFIENNDTVRSKVFNSTKYSQVGYDLAIGNPPYGDFTGKWAGMGEQQFTKAQTYVEYFITRGLDLVVSGGLLIYIVGVEVANGGKPFLAQGMTKAKEAIAEKAEILEAYRLPNGVFDRTDVVTDIIVLRKK